MGYEIEFKYYERDEENQYNTSEEKFYKKNIGKRMEEVPLSKVASMIMSQLARRDIWVIDVEICEYVKKKISFRETKGGVVLKNKKFVFDKGDNLLELEEEVIPSAQGTRNQISSTNITRAEVFEPDKDLMEFAMQKGLKLTLGKTYQILGEVPAGPSLTDGINYLVIDDEGEKIHVNSLYFTVPTKLIGGFENKSSSSIPLSNSGQYSYEMPVIRRK